MTDWPKLDWLAGGRIATFEISQDAYDVVILGRSKERSDARRPRAG